MGWTWSGQNSDLGGWEIQFNVVSADSLKEAQRHPEDHRDLVVRGSGI